MFIPAKESNAQVMLKSSRYGSNERRVAGNQVMISTGNSSVYISVPCHAIYIELGGETTFIRAGATASVGLGRVRQAFIK